MCGGGGLCVGECLGLGGAGAQRAQHMVPRGLEPRTLRLLAVRSNQLSYETFALVAAFPDGLLLCFESVALSACIIAMSRGLCNREQPHWIGNSPPSSAGRAQGP